MGAPDVGPGEVAISLDLHPDQATHIDSAICAGPGRASIDGDRIRVRLTRELCSERSLRAPLVVRLRRPEPGRYVVVYDDLGADLPRLGIVEIPPAPPGDS